MTETQLDEDCVVDVTLEEIDTNVDEEYIGVQNVEINRRLFEQHFTTAPTPEIIDNNTIHFHDGNGEKIIISARWEFMGEYLVGKVEEENAEVAWAWSWKLLPDDHNKELRESLKEMPENLAAYRAPCFVVDNPAHISILFSHMTDIRKYNHIFVHKGIDGRTFQAFGLWFTYPVRPSKPQE